MSLIGVSINMVWSWVSAPTPTLYLRQMCGHCTLVVGMRQGSVMCRCRRWRCCRLVRCLAPCARAPMALARCGPFPNLSVPACAFAKGCVLIIHGVLFRGQHLPAWPWPSTALVVTHQQKTHLTSGREWVASAQVQNSILEGALLCVAVARRIRINVYYHYMSVHHHGSGLCLR